MSRPQRRRALRGVAAVLALPALATLPACGLRQPLHLGFVGTLSRRASDLGESGRNGVMLAVETRNAAGGLAGQPVRLAVEDDGQNARQAKLAFEALQAAGVHAVVGPFTSAMATTLVPLAGAAGLPLVSPTVTSMDFYGKDDPLFRIHRTTRDNARDYATVLAARGWRRAAVAMDVGNRSFTQSWLSEFSPAFADGGGRVVLVESYSGDVDASATALVRRLVQARPDGLLFLSNTIDTARLAQRSALLAPGLPRAAAEWAATEVLPELGGRAIDGLLILQAYDRDDPSPRYRAFDEAFRRRFLRAPGYAAVAAHDAASVLMQAHERRQRGQSLRDALLANGPYDGLQQLIRFDGNGDTERRIVFTEVRDGTFRALQ